MQPAVITLIFLAVVLLLGLVGALKGLSRGLSRQVIRTLTIVGSVALSIFIVKTFSDSLFIEFFEGKTTQDLINLINEVMAELEAEPIDLSLLANFDIDTLRYLISLPISLVLMPFIFVLFFIVISFLMLIVHAIVSGILGFRKKRNNALTRLLGFVLGAVQGVAVAFILMTPIFGYAQVYTETVSILEEQMPENETVVAMSAVYDTYVKPTYEHPLIKFAKNAGCDALFSAMVTVKFEEDVAIDMTDTVPTLASVFADATSLGGADFKSLTPDQEQTIKSIISTIDENDFLATILSGAVRGVAYSYTEGALPLEIGEPFDKIIDSAISIFHTSDRDNIASDLATIADVYFVLSRDGVLVAFEGDSDTLMSVVTKRDPETGKTPINDVIDAINSNPRIKPLISMLTRLSVELMASNMDLGEDGAQLYDKVTEGLNNTLAISKEGKTEEEYVAEVSASINTTLVENGIELEPEIVDTMAQYVNDNIDVESGATAEDILITYFDAWLEYQETGTVPDDIPGGIPGGIPDGIPVPDGNGAN